MYELNSSRKRENNGLFYVFLSNIPYMLVIGLFKQSILIEVLLDSVKSIFN